MRNTQLTHYPFYGKRYDLIIHFSRYMFDNALAVMLEDKNTHEDFADASVNLPESATLPKDCAFVDTNNLPNIHLWLIENGIADQIVASATSGFCEYPALHFVNLPKER